MLARLHEPNVLQARVEADGLQRRNGQWTVLDENHLPGFPRLPLDYLRDLTFGTYQLELAPTYVQHKLQRGHTEIIELDLSANDPGLITLIIFSRFRNATKHQLWIAFNQDVQDDAGLVQGL
ncbi:unnamed protein product [Ceutorhynchus assimilis]|uniref:Uncharacterized protein n=1 Tax=Ceutorhynchus assimilis TaxID=467358 RepID=A0A9N9QDI9_9CUCU|nr:unnamed protein product [Ceutorhynchus assimilis]